MKDFFTYGKTSDPLYSSYYSSAESVTPKNNSTPRNNTFNLLPYVPSDPYSGPSLSDSSLSDSSDSLDDEFSKPR